MNDISSLNVKNSRPQEGAQSATRPQEGSQPAARQAPGTAQSEGKNQVAVPGTVPARGEREVSVAETEALVKELNSALEAVDGNYSVSVDGDTGMVVVRITDTDTGELVKQVPPQQMLDISMSVEKIIGLLVNDQA